MTNKLKYLLGLTFLLTIYLFACNNNGEQVRTESEPVTDMPDISQSRQEIDYLQEGRTIAEQSQAALAKNLIGAINTGGTDYAVEFCNVKAIPITDSMGNLLAASVKRVTDKPRNIANQAGQNELIQLTRMEEEMSAGGVPKPAVAEINGKMVGYYAIVTNELCTKCHGTKNETIEPSTLKKILALYPHDQAVGYRANELRGMWVVEMDKK